MAKTPVYGLPTLSAVVDATSLHSTNSKAFLVKGNTSDIANPFGGDSLNPFKKWTEPKVISNKTGFSLESQSENEYWFLYSKPGTYEVRMSGYSELGWFVRQIASANIELTDNDSDGMIDQWETQYGITDPDADEDGDGLTNLEEFQAGKFPKTADNNETLTAPQNVKAIAGNKQLALSWDKVTYATMYDICMATETITDPDNCSAHQNGTLFLGKQSPSVIADLNNGTEYFFVIMARNNNGVGAPSVVVSATPFVPVYTGKLNDTGITKCADNLSNNLDCPVSTHPKQDAQSGRDVTHNDDSDGHAGFSFTKISSTGAELPATATEWSCVKDNVTGLIWENKTSDSGLHDKNDRYNWYNTDNTSNGGSVGYADNNGDVCYGYNASDSASYCNTQAYVARVNADGWCGATDWRMPTRAELRSIVDYSIAYPGPTIDTDYFPNTLSSVVWSSSPLANDSSDAWSVAFYYGVDGTDLKNYSGRVRLVRSGQ